MEYKIFEITLDSDVFEVCGEDEHTARVACAHSNRKSVNRITSCRQTGETDIPYIRLLYTKRKK